MTVLIYKHRRATGHCCSADSTDKGIRNIRVADPNGVTLTAHAADIGTNIDIIGVTPLQPLAGVLAQGGVEAATEVAPKGAATHRGVAVAPARSKRTRADAGVAVGEISRRA